MSTQYNDPKGAIGATKVPLGLIPPHAMEQTAWVHKLGADKYGAWNWRETGVCASTYVNAILRHLNAWRDGEDLDPESGISHLAHIACSCNILMDAAKVGKLQDDRNKLSFNKTFEDVEKEWFELDESIKENEGGMTDAEFERIIASLRDDLEDFGFELSVDDESESDTVAEYRILKEDESLQDGDEVYVGEDQWCPVYIADWMTVAVVRNGTYRRKITDCDLKEEPETCCSNSEPQDMGECTCGRRYIYHWLYGWLCEDCDLKPEQQYP